jgi:hypothetical protein
VYIIAELGYNDSNIEKGLPMPINTDLLIAAAILQDSFVDKDGTPMSGGTVTCYQDNSRTTLKNWYYQSGTPGNYTYIKLPNPLTLSAAGTICDINGVDTIPFFYPYSELDQSERQPYYITIVNHAMTNQITRANFPFLASEENEIGIGSHDNYIINNGFWRNIGSANLTNVLNTIVAPSQHDGFSSPDIQFFKNVTGGEDTLTFTNFPLTTVPILTGDITPEFYINHTTSNTPTGETQKCYQFPISLHVNTLASVPFTVTIQAQNAGGTATGQNVINLFILQNTGTGTTSPAPFLISSITLNGAWTKYEFTSVFPATSGLTLGNGGDDALYLQVQMPLNITCSINFTKPSIYLNNVAPTNSFQTYDQVDAIINSPRTGDIRTSINSFYPYGWVPMSDGTIGYNPNSMATYLPTALNSKQAWQLYNLIWTMFQPYTGVSSNPICPMINSSGASIAYGGSAIADFNANNSLTLTKMMGRVMLGAVPQAALILAYANNFTGSNSAGNLLLTASGTMNLWNGMPFHVSNTGGALPGGLGQNTVYYVSGFNGTNTFFVATSFANALSGTVIGYTSSGTGTSVIDTSLAGTTTGEYAHTQLLNEMIDHVHVATPANFVNTGSGGVFATGGNGGSTGLTGGVSGHGVQTAFNVTQPATFYNIFMKL